MIIERFFTPGLAQVAYLVADEDAGVAAVIDPRRDVEGYAAFAAARGLRIGAVLETHLHADFVSGARELAAAAGAPIYASGLAAQGFPRAALGDGDAVAVGRLALRALWTPGHTPEHLAFLLTDPSRGPEPVALFSGDALLVGEVGRPDLLGEPHTHRLAEQLYQTVADRLGRLADDLIVYPGHTAGSACGKKIGDAPTTTVGREKRFGYAFQAGTEEAFARIVLADMPAPPTYYPFVKRINAAGPALLRDLAGGEPLLPGRVVEHQAQGGVVIDARTPAAFGEGHVPGAVFVGLGPSFVTWLGWLAPYGRDLVLVLDDDRRFEEARTELRRIGLDRVAGYLAGGMAAWRASALAVATLPQISPPALAARLGDAPDGLLVLDVRSDEEWRGGHIPGAVHRFGGEIARGASSPIGEASQVAVVCGSGYRSSVAASLLRHRGAQNLVNVAGGMTAWLAAGLPTSTA